MNVAIERMTISEAAQYLRVSERQVRRFIREDGLPHVELSPRCRLILRGDLDDWLEARRKRNV